MTAPRANAPGAVYGAAGGSVTGGGFGERGAVGEVGEHRTAKLLAEIAARPGGPTIMHDLRIPIPGFLANIDHAVVSGRSITLLDSKVWTPGFYWTLAGTTRRGMKAIPHADKRTLPTAVDGVRRMLERQRIKASFRTSILVIWNPSGKSPSNYWLYSPAGARVVASPTSPSRLARLVGTSPAAPDIVQALAPLLQASTGTRTRTRT